MKKKSQKITNIYITQPDYQRLSGLIEINLGDACVVDACAWSLENTDRLAVNVAVCRTVRLAQSWRDGRVSHY